MADTKDLNQNEGEGSRSADLDYRRRQAEFDRTHDAEKLAEKARADVEKNPAEYKQAEDVAKARSKVDGHEKWTGK